MGDFARLLCVLFGWPGALPSPPITGGFLGTTALSATLMASARLFRLAYSTRSSELRHLGPLRRTFRIRARARHRGLPRVVMEARCRHARITHTDTVRHVRLPRYRTESPFRAGAGCLFALARACRLALGPTGSGVSPDTLPCAMTHAWLGSHRLVSRLSSLHDCLAHQIGNDVLRERVIYAFPLSATVEPYELPFEPYRV